MAKKIDVPKAAMDAALTLAALQGWRHTTLRDIADTAKLPLSELYQHYPSKGAILAAIMRRTDQTLLRAADLGEGELARDRLFDVIMQRFDAMADQRDAVRAIVKDMGRDPLAMVCQLGQPFRRSMVWMLEAAAMDSGGLRGAVRVRGLGLLYLSVLRVWLDDDSEDLSKTMAALDKRLKRIDRLVGAMPACARRGQAARAEPVEA